MDALHPTALVEALQAQSSMLPTSYDVRLLDVADIEQLIQFRLHIVNTLSHPDHYRMAGEAPNFVRDHVTDKGVTIGVFRKDKLIAYGALGVPKEGDLNRGRDLSLPNVQWPLVVHMASAMVLPSERKIRLHHWLINARLHLARALGRRHVVSTVSPWNHVSWSNLASFGIYPRRLIDTGMGASACRFLLHGELNVVETLEHATAHLVPLQDLQSAFEIFNAGRIIWARTNIGGDFYGISGHARRAGSGNLHRTISGFSA